MSKLIQRSFRPPFGRVTTVTELMNALRLPMTPRVTLMQEVKEVLAKGRSARILGK